MRSLELKIPPLLLGFVIALAMGAAPRFVPALGFAVPGGRAIAAGLALAGTIVAALGIVSFRRARTTVNPLHPDRASALVVSGIYRITRNPMYLGFLIVLAGWAVFLANGLAAALLPAYVVLMNRLQIVPEERILAEKFGADFAAYRSRVRRWL